MGATRGRSAAQPPASALARARQLDAALSKSLFTRFGAARGLTRSALKFVERLGQGWLWFGAPVVVLALSADEAQRGAAATLLAAMLFDLATVAVLKALVRRPRPPYNVPDMLVVSVDRYSFPSGHASRSTVLAGLALGCAAALGEGAAAGSMVCAWAALTSVSRVVMGRHYAGDVLAGAALGTLELLAVRAAAPPMCAAWRRA